MDLYAILGVTKESSDEDIKKNYRKLAKEFHPDKNPEEGDKFKEISFAYEVLSNPDKRKIYDRYGLKGLQEGSEGGFSDASDLFAQWFPFSSGQNFGNSSSASGSRSRASQVVVKVEVTLEEIYSGNVSKSFAYKRTEYCPDCEGQGGPKEAMEQCKACGGVGRTASYAFMGLSGFEALCRVCNGRGQIIMEDKRCSRCTGAGLIEVEHTREITVEKGAPHLLKIPFRSEGHQPITGERGDLIVILMQQAHPLFVRKENDLLLHRDINITQSLCGFVYCFQHLDGRNICMSSKPGDVVRHGDMKMVCGEGMPLLNNPFERGDLYVQFRVEFPENNFTTLSQLQLLETLLPPREPFTMPEEAEEVQMVEVPETASGGSEGEDGNDFEGGSQFQGVQCQTA